MNETGRSKKERGSESTTPPKPAPIPIALIAVAWLVPGAGHWLLGKRIRAVVFAAAILCAFVTGTLLSGELGTPKPDSPFTWLTTFACLGNGLLYFVRLIWLNGLGGLLASFPFEIFGGGSSAAAGFAYGNAFLYTAGLMNLLTILDASDIARGEKS